MSPSAPIFFLPCSGLRVLFHVSVHVPSALLLAPPGMFPLRLVGVWRRPLAPLLCLPVCPLKLSAHATFSALPLTYLHFHPQSSVSISTPLPLSRQHRRIACPGGVPRGAGEEIHQDKVPENHLHRVHTKVPRFEPPHRPRLQRQAVCQDTRRAAALRWKAHNTGA